jgi:hypothetical protein
VGAGIAVAVDQATHHTHIGDRAAGMALAIPVAVYIISVWLVQYRPRTRCRHSLAFPLAAVLVLLTPLLPLTPLLVALLLAALTAHVVIAEHRAQTG